MNERLDRWKGATEPWLLALAVGSLPLLVLEVAEPDLIDADRLFLASVNVFVFVAFAGNLALEVVLSNDKRTYLRHEWLGVVIVVAQGLALLPSLGGLGFLRIFRALRAARMWRVLGGALRATAFGTAAAKNGRAVLRKHAASFALGMAGFTWISSAVAFHIAEAIGPRGRHESFFDALWWSTTTITTVGYGDVSPTTGVGRLIAAVTMLVGISTFAVVTAKVAELLVRDDSE